MRSLAADKQCFKPCDDLSIWLFTVAAALKDRTGQISALSDDPHCSHNLDQTSLKIGTRRQREGNTNPKIS